MKYVKALHLCIIYKNMAVLSTADFSKFYTALFIVKNDNLYKMKIQILIHENNSKTASELK